MVKRSTVLPQVQFVNWTSFPYLLSIPPLLFILCLISPGPSFADETSELDSFMELSLEDLLNVDVTSVSKKTEKRSDAAAAIYVITNEDIRKSTATNIPDLLRVVPGVNVAQLDAHTWSVTVRGGGGEFATKLLVLVDGRSVYTPYFSGVYWDSVDVVLEDIDRIEIIRGPGGTLWGANAVNGVINIVTKRASDTQGGLLSVISGSNIDGSLSLRYGGTLKENQFYRVYAKGFQVGDSGDDQLGADAHDEWKQGRGGFRFDTDLNEEETLTIQGDYFSNSADENFYIPNAFPPAAHTLQSSTKNHTGFNTLARWTNKYSDTGSIQLQAYVDSYHYESIVIDERRTTFDIEFQHRVQLNDRHEVVWGVGYRNSGDSFDSNDLANLDPDSDTTDLFSLFLQDEITINDELKVIIGSKLEHNDYTGIEVQPTIRALWSPTENQTVWGAVSRAIRTPNRAENDIRLLFLPLPGFSTLPVAGVVFGSSSFDSLELISYEVGYRASIYDNLLVDATAFYNDYEGERDTAPFLAPSLPFNVPLQLNNDIDFITRGIELTLDYRPYTRWLLRGGYSFIDTNNPGAGLNSPQQQFTLGNEVNITETVYAGATLRYVDMLSDLGIDDYLTMDARAAWKPRENLELSVNGRNLFDDEQTEFIEIIANRASTAVERSVYGQITWEF